jgi:hypothetical protein
MLKPVSATTLKPGARIASVLLEDEKLLGTDAACTNEQPRGTLFFGGRLTSRGIRDGDLSRPKQRLNAVKHSAGCASRRGCNNRDARTAR